MQVSSRKRRFAGFLSGILLVLAVAPSVVFPVEASYTTWDHGLNVNPIPEELSRDDGAWGLQGPPWGDGTTGFYALYDAFTIRNNTGEWFPWAESVWDERVEKLWAGGSGAGRPSFSFDTSMAVINWDSWLGPSEGYNVGSVKASYHLDGHLIHNATERNVIKAFSQSGAFHIRNGFGNHLWGSTTDAECDAALNKLGFYILYDDKTANGVLIGDHACGGPGIYRRKYVDATKTTFMEFVQMVKQLQEHTNDGYVRVIFTKNPDGSGGVADNYSGTLFRYYAYEDLDFVHFEGMVGTSSQIAITYDYNGGKSTHAAGSTFTGYRLTQEMFGYPDLYMTMEHDDGTLEFDGWYKSKAGADNLTESQKAKYWDRFTSDTTLYAGWKEKEQDPWFDVIYVSPDGMEHTVLGSTVGNQIYLDADGNMESETDLDLSKFLSGDEYFIGYFDSPRANATELDIGSELLRGDKVYLHTAPKTQLNFVDRHGSKVTDMDIALGYPISRFNAGFPDEIKDREFATKGGKVITIDTALTAGDFGDNDTAESMTVYETGVDTYNVTFDAGEGRIDGEKTVVLPKDDGTALGTLPVPTHDSKNFLGWYTMPSGGTKVGEGTVVTKDVTYHVHWDAGKAVVTFDPCGGTLAGDDTRQVAIGSVIGTMPDVTRNGYRFLGWFMAATGGTEASSLTTVSQNLTVYAQWERIDDTRTVTFDANGGTVTERYRDVQKGDTLGILPTAYRPGYDLVGWYTVKDGGTKISEFAVIDANVTYYAQWKEVQVKQVVETLRLNHETLDVKFGDDLDLAYSFTPLSAENAMFYWTSSDEGVIRVNGDTFSYAGAGTTVLTLHTLDESRTASVEVRVSPVEKRVESLAFNRRNQSVLQGNAVDLSYRYAPLGADNADFLFRSSDPDILSVEPDGSSYTFGKKGGTVTVTVSTADGSVSDTCTVSVLLRTSPEDPQEIHHQVMFHTMGGNELEPLSVRDGDTCELPVPTREGYEFSGWYLANGTRVESLTVVSDVAVYARWNKVLEPGRTEHTVRIYPGNGSPATVRSIPEGDPVGTLPEVYREGYRFLGWFDAPAGGNEVTAGMAVTRNLQVYAQWEEIHDASASYDLRLFPNGGTFGGSDGTLVLSGILSRDSLAGSDLSQYVPERAGCTFTGWYTSASGGELVYDANGRIVDGSRFDSTGYLGSGDLMLYAGWAGNVDQAVLSFDTRGGSPVPDQAYAVGSRVDALPYLVRDGYVFKGWSLSEDGDIVASVILDGDTKLYAIWEKAADPVEPEVTYTLTYDTDGGEELSPVALKAGTVVRDFPVPVKVGYQFLGWMDEDGNLAASVTMDGDRTLTASWKLVWGEPQMYTVRLHSNYPDGPIQVYELPVGNNPLGMDVFTREGYRFLGWFTERGGGEEVTVCTGPEDVTLYAHWEKIPEEEVLLDSVWWSMEGIDGPTTELTVDASDVRALNGLRYHWSPGDAASAADFRISSSDPGVVSVDDNGLCMVTGTGTADLAVVYAKDSTKRAAVRITVTDGKDDAVKAVMDKIAAIGEVTLSNGARDRIEDARGAYEALTEGQKGQVTNLDVLVAAENRYRELLAEQGGSGTLVPWTDSGTKPGSTGNPSGNGGTGVPISNGSASGASDNSPVRGTGKNIAAPSVATADSGAVPCYAALAAGLCWLLCLLGLKKRFRK